MAYAHVPYTFVIERPQLRDDTASWIHDPYSFAGYITLKDEPQYCYHHHQSLMGDAPECSTSRCSEPTTDASSLSTGHTSTSPSDDAESNSDGATTPETGGRRRRVRYVRGPCGHKNSKRLRFKNGQGQYICLECNLKWRSAFDEEMIEE